MKQEIDDNEPFLKRIKIEITCENEIEEQNKLENFNDKKNTEIKNSFNYLIKNKNEITQFLNSIPQINQSINKIKQKVKHECIKNSFLKYLFSQLLDDGDDDDRNFDENYYYQLIISETHLVLLIDDIYDFVENDFCESDAFISNLIQYGIGKFIKCDECKLEIDKKQEEEMLEKFFIILKITYNIPENRYFEQWYVPILGEITPHQSNIFEINSNYIYIINYLYPKRELVTRIENIIMAINFLVSRNEIHRVRIKSTLLIYIHCLFSFHQINNIRDEINTLQEYDMDISFKVYLYDSWNHKLEDRIEEIAKQCEFNKKKIKFKLFKKEQDNDNLKNNILNINDLFVPYQNKIYLETVKQDLFTIFNLPTIIKTEPIIYRATNKEHELIFWLRYRRKMNISYPTYCKLKNEIDQCCVYCKLNDVDLVLDCLHVIHKSCLNKIGVNEYCPCSELECGESINPQNTTMLRNYFTKVFGLNYEMEKYVSELYEDMSVKITWKRSY